MKIRLAIYIGYYLLNLFVIKDILALLITLPTMALVIFNLRFIRSRYVVVDDMLTFVIYLFFVIEPLQQLDHGHIGTQNVVSPISFSNYYIIEAAAMVWIFYAIYSFGIRALAPYRQPMALINISQAYAGPLLILALGAGVLTIILMGGLANILAPRYEKTAGDTSVLWVAADSLQMVSAFLLASLVRSWRDRSLIYLAIAIAMLLLCHNPFNSARFVLLSVYIPLILIMLRGRIKASFFYAMAMVGITIVMPVLSQTSRYGSIRAALAQGNNEGVRSVFDLPYVDVWDMLVECARFTDINGYAYGAKLGGTLLFFVPRSIWTNKPVLNALDIGYQLANDRITGTFNLSMFFIGDGFRDAGFFGVVIYSLLVLFILYFLLHHRQKLINGQPIMEFMFMASLPILARGPLVAVIAIFFLQAVWLAVLHRTLSRPALTESTPSELITASRGTFQNRRYQTSADGMVARASE